MTKETPSSISSVDNTVIFGDKVESGMRGKLDIMRSVRLAAINLTDKYSDHFSVLGIQNDYLTKIYTVTECEIEIDGHKTAVMISLKVIAESTGQVVNEIDIRPAVSSIYAAGALGYRLTFRQGAEIEETYQSLFEQADSDSDLGRIFKVLLDESYEQADGVHVHVADIYAETTITAERAIYILENAVNFHRPDSRDRFRDSISLTEFKAKGKQSGFGNISFIQ